MPPSVPTRPGDVRDALLRTREWILLDGLRRIVSAMFVLFLLALLVLVNALVDNLFADVMPLYYVYGALISGNLTLVTVVVSINQLLLSRELSTPGELRNQMEGSINYHEKVEETAGRAVPVEPQGFLRILFQNLRQAAQQLGGLSYSETDEELYDEIDEIVVTVTRHADRVDDLLQSTSASTFSVLSTTLTTNYAKEINQLRNLHQHDAARLPDEADEQIDELVHRLQDVDIARQYFKSVYLKEELALLSRLLVFTGLPAVAVLSTTILLFTTGATVAVPPGLHSALFIVTLTVGLFPMAVLVAFILRTATVTERTVATLPFTAPAQEYH